MTEEYLNKIDSVIENGKYKASWDSLCNHETPKWYHKAKFGIFIHWEFTVCLLLATNGIQEICMIKFSRNTGII